MTCRANPSLLAKIPLPILKHITIIHSRKHHSRQPRDIHQGINYRVSTNIKRKMPSKSHLALLPLLLSAISFTAHATPIISSSSEELSSNENDNDRRASCPSVHIFGARETTASAGYGSAGTVVNLILNAYPGSTAEAIVYPACGGQSSCGSVSYASSVQQGTTAVASAVNAYYSSCPSTSLVLVGYSQVCVGSFFDGWRSGFLYPFFLFFSSFFFSPSNRNGDIGGCIYVRLRCVSESLLTNPLGINPQGAEIIDNAFCGGGDPNQGVTNTAVLISSGAVAQIKAVILMGTPTYVYGLSYDVGTCKAGGVSSYSLTYGIPPPLPKHFFQRLLTVRNNKQIV